jgi:hypothetical protein
MIDCDLQCKHKQVFHTYDVIYNSNILSDEVTIYSESNSWQKSYKTINGINISK